MRDPISATRREKRRRPSARVIIAVRTAAIADGKRIVNSLSGRPSFTSPATHQYARGVLTSLGIPLKTGTIQWLKGVFSGRGPSDNSGFSQ